MASTQTVLLGSLGPATKRAVSQLYDQRAIKRLWESDASLWSADPDVQATIRQRLGWRQMIEVMARQTDELQALRQEVRGAGIRRVLLLGMGGSGLFAEVCRQIFGVEGDGLELQVLDTTDPTAIRAAHRQGPLKQLLVLVSSKSGTTSETVALSTYFSHAFESAGLSPGKHCIAITDEGTPLAQQAHQSAYRRVLIHGAQTGATVGGRFSALTYFGLVPAALLGVDVDQLLRRAQEALARYGPTGGMESNPAAQLAAVLAAAAQTGRDKLTLLCGPALASFGTWAEQLVAESTGKQDQGIVPIQGEPVQMPSAYHADRVFLELQVEDAYDKTVERHAHALAEVGHPVVRLVWHDRYDLGGEVIRWSVATSIVGVLLGVNPFDEPSVTESKDRTSALLQAYARDGRLAEPSEPIFLDEQVALYGPSPSEVGRSLSMTQCLAAWFQQRRANDYLALLSFLPQTVHLEAGIHALRTHLFRELGLATVVGYGPRYLHSTGQLFKGGADRGLFLMLTADETDDLPIPGEPWSFGVLKRAQALGDFQAMQQRGRRILRVHVRRDLDTALQRLTAAIDEAVARVVRR